MDYHANPSEYTGRGSLKDASAVLIVNGTSPDDETLQKGREEAVPLLGTTRSAFEASGMIYRLLQNENG